MIYLTNQLVLMLFGLLSSEAGITGWLPYPPGIFYMHSGNLNSSSPLYDKCFNHWDISPALQYKNLKAEPNSFKLLPLQLLLLRCLLYVFSCHCRWGHLNKFRGNSLCSFVTVLRGIKPAHCDFLEHQISKLEKSYLQEWLDHWNWMLILPRTF